MVWDHEVAGSNPVTPTQQETPGASLGFVVSIHGSPGARLLRAAALCDSVLKVQFDADVQHVAPEHFLVEAIGRAGRAVDDAERRAAGDETGVDVRIKLLARAEDVVPQQERIAEFEANVLMDIDADVEA